MQIKIRYILGLFMFFMMSCQARQTLYEELPEKFDEAGKVLSGEEIHRVFSGKTWEGYSQRNICRIFHEDDGFFMVVANRDGYFDTSRRKLVGKWWVEGNRHCIRLDRRQRNCSYCHVGRIEDKLEKDLCNKIVTDGKGGFKKISPTGKVIYHFQRVLTDNPYRK